MEVKEEEGGGRGERKDDEGTFGLDGARLRVLVSSNEEGDYDDSVSATLRMQRDGNVLVCLPFGTKRFRFEVATTFAHLAWCDGKYGGGVLPALPRLASPFVTSRVVMCADGDEEVVLHDCIVGETFTRLPEICKTSAGCSVRAFTIDRAFGDHGTNMSDVRWLRFFRPEEMAEDNCRDTKEVVLELVVGGYQDAERLPADRSTRYFSDVEATRSEAHRLLVSASLLPKDGTNEEQEKEEAAKKFVKELLADTSGIEGEEDEDEEIDANVGGLFGDDGSGGGGGSGGGLTYGGIGAGAIVKTRYVMRAVRHLRRVMRVKMRFAILPPGGRVDQDKAQGYLFGDWHRDDSDCCGESY